ncbi:MAG: N-acetylmuramoyl-L-alanine amidase [Bacteroidota bacterium]
MAKKLKYTFLPIFLLCFSFVANAEPSFHQVKAQDGDGVYSLLRRYNLDVYRCNFSKFYALNDLRKSATLVKGRSYYLPIFVYRYDGKSIRTTIGISDWDQAVRIQTYNNELVEKEIRKESYAKSRVLWVPYHEMNCLDEVKKNLTKPESKKDTVLAAKVTPKPKKEQPVITQTKPITGKNLSTQAAGKRSYPIFGPKYAYTPLVSEKMKGKVVYIVAGHGGPDPGAVGKRDGRRLCEDEYAYDVALRLCRNLISHGATAYMITRDPDDGIREGLYLKCDEDEVVWGNYPIERGQKARLFQRSNAINELYKKNKWRGVTQQIVVVVHVDSRAQKQQIDLFFYHHPSDAKGKALAKKLQSTMSDKYKVYRASKNYFGTVTARDLHMLREVEAPAIYIELGNIKHSRDQQRIVIERNRQLLADWLLEGLMKW